MKKFLITSLFLLLSVFAGAQNVKTDFVSESKAAKFEESKGAIIKKEFFEMPEGKGWLNIGHIVPAIITDVRTGSIEAFVRVEIGGASSILDYDEIPACLEALNYIISEETSTKPPKSEFIEVIFRSRDGLEIGAFSETFKKYWKTVIVHTKYVSEPSTTTSIKNLQDIVTTLEIAQNFLADKID